MGETGVKQTFHSSVLYPHVASMATAWDERLKREFPMALTKDVTAGRVTANSYNLAQGHFIRESLTYLHKEIAELQHLGGVVHDFGIGEGSLLPIANYVNKAGLSYNVWDFCETARAIGRRTLSSLLPHLNTQEWVKPGSLQTLFGDDEAYHFCGGFTLGIFSRILQHNPEDISTILANAPLQVKPGGKIVVITVFADDNEHVEHDSSFCLLKKADFMDMINARTSSFNRLSIINEKSNIIVDSEKYTALTLSS